jgi:hypothetical protein
MRKAAAADAFHFHRRLMNSAPSPFQKSHKPCAYNRARHPLSPKSQGSGKSLLMAFYAGQVVKHQGMENPTIVVLTDRNDLDDQLFGTFSRMQGPHPPGGGSCARPSQAHKTKEFWVSAIVFVSKDENLTKAT